MGGENQINTEIPASNVGKVHFNPDKETFIKVVESASDKILDIGCGENANVSWKLFKDKQLLVACDPLITENSLKNSRKILETKKGNYIFFNKDALDVYEFYPNVISVIAPNQSDVNGGLFYTFDKFLGNKEQTMFVILDTRTQEALENKKAVHNILDWMRNSKFKIVHNDEVENLKEEIEYLEADLNFECHLSPKSNDLGSINRLIVAVRNSKE